VSESAATPLGIELAAALLAGGGALLVAWGLYARLAFARVDARLHTYVGLAPVARRTHHEPLRARLARLAPLVARLGRAIDSLLPDRQVERIRGNLAAAGLLSGRDLTNFLAAKALLAAGMAILGPLLFVRSGTPGSLDLLLALIGGALGFYAPGIWLGRRIARRRLELGRALPDALDLLSISVSAGLGFDSALIEVVQRWQNPLTEELGGVLRDMRLGKGRREALRALATRTQLPDVAGFVAAIVQADELGTPIRDTLRTQADQVRQRRRQRAEERARQATIKMLIPMALFIFPAIFVVLLGPIVPSLTSLRH
jgi:tight adherence protein C